MKHNKVVRIALAGGIIGWLTTNPRRALENRIERENEQGWTCTYFIPHRETNLFIILVQIVLLVCTFGLWTFGAGYMALFEKEKL